MKLNDTSTYTILMRNLLRNSVTVYLKFLRSIVQTGTDVNFFNAYCISVCNAVIQNAIILTCLAVLLS